MKLSVIHTDEKECEKLAQAVKGYLEKLQKQLVLVMGVHELVLISETAGTVMETGILDGQVFNRSTRLSLLQSIAAKDTLLRNNSAITNCSLNGMWRFQGKVGKLPQNR